MYKSLLKYKNIELSEINTDVVAFSANTLISSEIFVRNIFITNNNVNNQTFICYILNTNDNSKFYLAAENESISEGGSISIINQPIYLKSNEQIIFNGNKENIDITICITYDVGV